MAGEDVCDPRFRIAFPSLNNIRAADGPEQILLSGASTFHLHLNNGGANPPAVLLPFDKLFEVRAAAALRLWRGLAKRNPGTNPAALSPQRRKRLVLALRTLDARLQTASYREIATVLFDLPNMADAVWQSHELRGQIIRLAKLGTDLMQGGYRNLLLYPYRRRP
jgi:hypothetical protein